MTTVYIQRIVNPKLLFLIPFHAHLRLLITALTTLYKEALQLDQRVIII